MSECSRGWGNRCPASRGPRCTCRCGGENHGKAFRNHQESAGESLPLTNHKIFEAQFGKNYRFILPSALQLERDFHFERDNLGTHSDVPRRYVVHSPTGFEWGYGGSGPADLALNILGVFLPAPEAWRLHQKFKWAFVATANRDAWAVGAETVRQWIRGQWAAEAAEVAHV